MNKISTWVPRFIMRQTVVGTIWICWSSHTNCVCFIFYNKQCTKKVPKEHASTLVHKNYSIKQGRCSPFVENLLHGQVKWVDPILATVIDPSWRSYEAILTSLRSHYICCASHHTIWHGILVVQNKLYTEINNYHYNLVPCKTLLYITLNIILLTCHYNTRYKAILMHLKFDIPLHLSTTLLKRTRC